VIRTLRAVEFSRPMRVGSKNPALFLCEGGAGKEDVVVKFREILLRQQFSCVGEIVAALLAGDLGFPHAEPVVVELGHELAEVARASGWPDYGDRIERSAGLNFGSVFLGPGFDARLPSGADGTDLCRFWAELFCFDFVIQNYDRVADNPNYLRHGDRVILIDHEQAFRHLDDTAQEEFSVNALELEPFYRHVACPSLDLATDFSTFFRRLSELPAQNITRYFAELPSAWRDHRSIRLEQYLHWVRTHATELCERLTTLLAT